MELNVSDIAKSLGKVKATIYKRIIKLKSKNIEITFDNIKNYDKFSKSGRPNKIMIKK